MFNKSIFLIITFISHTLSLSSQIVNVDSKRQSEEKGLSGITEFTFDFNKSVQTDWEFSNITYLQWDNEKWSVLILNETNLDRARWRQIICNICCVYWTWNCSLQHFVKQFHQERKAILFFCQLFLL